VKRVPIGKWGKRGASVSVFAERGAVWLRLPTRGRTLRRFGDDTGPVRRKAIAWAKKYAAAREKGDVVAPEGKGKGLTLRALWIRYERANGESWRPKTRRGYEEYRDALEDHFTPTAKVAEITLDDVDEFRTKRRAQKNRRGEKMAHSQVRRQIGFLRQLMNFAEGRELIPRNRLRAYRYVVPKSERDARPGEYSRTELLAIAAQLAEPRHWRPRGIVTLCGSLGTRINAVLHLKWADVDLDAKTVIWRADFDKLGQERTQPLTPRAHAALLEAQANRHKDVPWVFWAVSSGEGHARRAHRAATGAVEGRPYHYNSVHYHLTEASARAGVPHLPGRAFHGLRRMNVGDLNDLSLAAAWLGQASLKITAGYDRERKERTEQARDRIAALEAPPERHHTAGEA
jgi:integrase